MGIAVGLAAGLPTGIKAPSMDRTQMQAFKCPPGIVLTCYNLTDTTSSTSLHLLWEP